MEWNIHHLGSAINTFHGESSFVDGLPIRLLHVRLLSALFVHVTHHYVHLRNFSPYIFLLKLKLSLPLKQLK